MEPDERALDALLNHLTVIKAAVQVLDRQAALTEGQHRLARTAVERADALAGELAAGRAPRPALHGRDRR